VLGRNHPGAQEATEVACVLSPPTINSPHESLEDCELSSVLKSSPLVTRASLSTGAVPRKPKSKPTALCGICNYAVAQEFLKPIEEKAVLGRDGDLRVSLYKALLIETQLGLDARLMELYQSFGIIETKSNPRSLI
jgi:hypothetical protein